MAILDLQEAIDLIEKGQARDAIPLLTTWTRQMPTHAAVHVVLARAYEAAAKWNEAQAAWKDAHFLMPNSPAVAAGLSRVRAASGEPAEAGEDRLMMDLDLQAELEATLEALFNPFTLPQQTEEKPDEQTQPVAQHNALLAQVEAALSAADDDAVLAPEEPPAAPEPADETDTAPPAARGEPTDPYASGTTSIYDEIAQLIEEKKSQKLRPQAEEQVKADTEIAEETSEWLDFEPDAEAAPQAHNKDFEDLERLISELESARIVPQPDLEDVPPPDLDDDIEGMVSETLARIYASQNQYQEAARVYEQLALEHPDEADRFHQLAADMHARAGGSDKD